MNELVKPILAFKKSAGLSKEERLKVVLKEIPLEIGWVRALIPQYERCRGQSVQLVGGMCLLNDHVFNYEVFDPQPGAPLTNVLLQTVEVSTGVDIFLLDLRKVSMDFPLKIPQ
jgi:hypothetical protein